ncbi:flagellin [Polynucleobacter sp. SHI8]|uniref:flagellin N-terminal helical domain-containing protein n=1 Tax=unclassified Polynucleobacter TaxID=2640945 RepID=UPI00248F9600|nr:MULTISPECIES: flagellin [unclassified Polynucleobacter]BDW11738.1 flagellin [Polynucleobacter sp. SHI2]BDW14185.1 flagellin [Polynucleobacter sp. SHI8]
MASIINTNITSLVAQNNLSMTQATLQTTIERLSSGLRVNSAADDASGYAIANRMDAQIRGMAVATRNANDGISFSQTVTGALSQISNNLQRMRELAVQAANGSNSASDTALLNQEFNQLQTEVARIQSSTSFNNVNVFQANDIVFQVGANTTSGDRVNMQGSPLNNTQTLGTQTITDRGILSAGADISAALAAASAISGASVTSLQNAAIDAINSSQKISFAVKNDLLNQVNTSAAVGGQTLAGLYTALVTTTATNIIGTAGGIDATPVGTAATAASGQTLALSAISAIDNALTEVNTASATQGALQNRFSAVISNLTAFSQSQTAAKSRIVDADFAAETAKLSKNQILQQAGTAMLAQANQLPSGILSLLKNG